MTDIFYVDTTNLKDFSQFPSNFLENLSSVDDVQFVISKEILKETFVNPGGLDGIVHPNWQGVKDWIIDGTSTGKVVLPEFEFDFDDISAVQKWKPGYTSGNLKGRGEIEIMELLSRAIDDGNTRHILSNNIKDFEPLFERVESFKGFDPLFNREVDQGKIPGGGVGYNSIDLLNVMYVSGDVSRADYERLTAGIATADRSHILSSASLDSFEDGPPKHFSFNSAAWITAGAEALRHAGLVGDALGVVVTAQRANELIASGNPADLAEAEALWGGLVGETAGGIAGGAGAAALAAILIPEPVSTVGGLFTGAVVLASSIVGGHFGAKAGSAFGTFAIKELQARAANGEAVVLDDILGLYSAFADANGLPPELPVEALQYYPIGQVSSARMPGQFGTIRAGDEMNMLDVLSEMAGLNESCFLAGTSIAMGNGSRKAIEKIVVGDEVLAFDSNADGGHGVLAPRRVTEKYINSVTTILDFFGTGITPGHVTLCGDGVFASHCVPIIDILASDGAIVKADGTLVRASTNAVVGSEDDRFIRVSFCTSKDLLDPKNWQVGQLRLGTCILKPDGNTTTLREMIENSGMTLLDNGFVCTPEGQEEPVRWYGELPRPEQYVLAKSGLTMADLSSDPHGEEHASLRRRAYGETAH